METEPPAPRPGPDADAVPTRPGPFDPTDDEQVLRRFDARPEATRNLLVREALALLDPADAALLDVEKGPKGGPEHAGGLAVAAARFHARLAWVAAREERGVPPIERRALGLICFRGYSAQAAAEALRLPVGVIERWARDGDLPTVAP